MYLDRSWGSSVSIVSAHPAFYLMGTGVLFLGVKHGQGVTNHPPPYSAKVKNE
jgi:hypothetical protein